MSNDTQPWTLGVWVAKPGREAEFRDAWTAFANWTSRNVPGAGEVFLLQDPQQPARFFSFSPWESEDDIVRWRGTPEFAAFVAKVRDLCESFQPNTLRVAVHVAPPVPS